MFFLNITLTGIGACLQAENSGGWVLTLWKEDHTVDMSYVPGIDSLEGEETCEEEDEEL